MVRAPETQPDAGQADQLVLPVAFAGPGHVGRPVRLPPPSTRLHLAGEGKGGKFKLHS